MKTQKSTVSLLAAGLLVISSAWFVLSAAAQTASHGPDAIVSDGIVSGETDQGIRYMMGGVGLGERHQMALRRDDFNVKLAFAERSGVYLAGVDVVVENHTGQRLLSLTSNGPWLYLQLPSGAYNVRATVDGQTRLIDNLRLNGERVTQVVHWNLPQEFPIYADMQSPQS
jgi:hypothetical protein